MAHHDHLTGLGNRVLFAEKLESDIARWSADGAEFAILSIDLDGFKKVNDTLGHDIGDALLVAVAARLLETAGADDFVARLGGDEFVVLSPWRQTACLWPRTGDPHSRRSAAALPNRISEGADRRLCRPGRLPAARL